MTSKYPPWDSGKVTPVGPFPQCVTPAPAQEADGMTEAQQSVYDVLERMPGATIQDVARELSLGHTTATYHLSCLAERGIVRPERDGRAVRHFLTDRQDDVGAYVDALLRDERKRRVLRVLASGRADGCTVNRLAKNVRLLYGFVRRTLDQLVDRGYVDILRHRGWHQVRARAMLRDAMARHDATAPTFSQSAIYDSSVAASSAPASLEVGPAGVPDSHR